METVEDCNTLTRWFLARRAARVAPGSDGYKVHVSMAANLIGKKGKKGKWSPKQVKRAVETFHRVTGRYPDSLGTLTSKYLSPDGSNWMEYANTPPAMPNITESWALQRWFEEWGRDLPLEQQMGIKGYLDNAIRPNTRGLRTGASLRSEVRSEQDVAVVSGSGAPPPPPY